MYGLQDHLSERDVAIQEAYANLFHANAVPLPISADVVVDAATSVAGEEGRGGASAASLPSTPPNDGS